MKKLLIKLLGLCEHDFELVLRSKVNKHIWKHCTKCNTLIDTKV